MSIINQRFFRSNVTGFINLPLNGNTILTLESNISALAPTDTKSYRIVFRADSPSGNIIATSNVITMYGNAFLSIQATGGTKTEEGNWVVHAFTSSDVFRLTSLSLLPERNTIQYLAVGGGGAPLFSTVGLQSTRAGGGAGGLLTGNITVTSDYVGNNAIIIGGGGSPSPSGISGANTVLFNSSPRSITAFGGGGGRKSGGSGGGGSVVGIPGTAPGLPGISGQGNPGFGGQGTSSNTPTSSRSDVYGGGGGGAGSGGPINTNSQINGGNGRAISWVPNLYGASGPTPGRWFAAGGGGDYSFRGTSGQGSTEGNPGAGYGPNNGSATQQGIVIIRYPKG